MRPILVEKSLRGSEAGQSHFARRNRDSPRPGSGRSRRPPPCRRPRCGPPGCGRGPQCRRQTRQEARWQTFLSDRDAKGSGAKIAWFCPPPRPLSHRAGESVSPPAPLRAPTEVVGKGGSARRRIRGEGRPVRHRGRSGARPQFHAQPQDRRSRHRAPRAATSRRLSCRNRPPGCGFRRSIVQAWPVGPGNRRRKARSVPRRRSPPACPWPAAGGQ